MNLVLNAYHAMRDAGGTLQISASQDAEWVCVYIEDTGCGIASGVSEHHRLYVNCRSESVVR